jgi:hydroxyethylthiazole kinase
MDQESTRGRDAAAAPDPVGAAADALARLRERRPRVHCLTNLVALELSANVLLAAGAVPSMSGHHGTVAGFVAATNALVVNLGMLDPEREAAILAAVATARELGRPWLLDPVKVELSPSRLVFAQRLLTLRPTVVRGNGEEIAALCGGGGPAGLARETGGAVARTGVEDLVTNGRRRASILGGSPLMERVTAVGCAAGALAGAFLAVEPDPWSAAVATLLVMAVAGEIAAGRARGPGTFAVELLDALYWLGPADLRERGRLR